MGAKHHMTRPMPSPSELRQFVALDPNSPSGLVWVARGKGRRVTGVAGSRNGAGYWSVCIAGVRWFAHRIIWVLTYGAIAENVDIDHRDQDPSNNAIGNLRIADGSGNQRNVGSHTGYLSQYKGVSRRRGREDGKSPWRAALRMGNGAYRWQKDYPSEIEAARGYNIAAYAVDPEFSRLNILAAPGVTITASAVTTDALRESVGLPPKDHA